MSVFHSPSVVVGTLVVLASLPAATHGHVQLAYPPAIIDDDYQYTFDGSCQYESCNAFCGRAGPDPIPVTTVNPGKLLTLKLNVNVKHLPFRYRVALSSASDALPGFDTNILLDDIEAPGNGSTEFDVTVDIPEDVTCSPYCTLQLFDYYYFVSCARIVIGDPDTLGAMATNSSGIVDSVNSGVDGSGNALPQYDVPSKVMFSQESTNDDTIMINATVMLADKSWFGIALSQTGAMIGSQALIGLPNVTSNGTSFQEFDLAGKFTEAIQPIVGVEQLATNASFDITEDSFGNYVHTLSAIFNVADVCGMQLIWAHANPNGATDVLGYHGTYRGVLGTIECAPQSSPSTAGNGDSVTMQGRDQDGAETTSAAAFVVARATTGTLLMAVVGVALLAM